MRREEVELTAHIRLPGVRLLTGLINKAQLRVRQQTSMETCLLQELPKILYHPNYNCAAYVVLPCFNEEKNLEQLISDLAHELSEYSFTIIIINDGSSDSSAYLLQKLSLKYPLAIITHKKNMGLSVSLRDGLLYAASCSKENDVIITMDADNTHKTFYIPQMIQAVENGADFVIASRYTNGGLQLGVSKDRILLSRGINYLINCLSGITIKDATSGYRCYKASLLKKAKEKYAGHLFDSKGFEIQVELLVKLGVFSNKITEIPFILRYDQKKGKSKMPLLQTIQNYIILSFKIITWRATA